MLITCNKHPLEKLDQVDKNAFKSRMKIEHLKIRSHKLTEEFPMSVRQFAKYLVEISSRYEK